MTKDMTLTIAPVAVPPSLDLAPPDTRLSRMLAETGFEGICDPDAGATVLTQSTFDGWSMQPVQKGKQSAFVIWSNGDKFQTANGKVTMNTNSGKEWLMLTNGANASNGNLSSKVQNLGIERNVDTIQGAKYTLNLNYAGIPGAAPGAANSKIVVTLDGKPIGSYANTSQSVGNGGLNWQNLNFSFDGDGQRHEIGIQLDAGASGAMLDAINLTETLPTSANRVYGFKGTPIPLPSIQAQLNANNPNGKLKVELLGLPKGVMLSDGVITAQTVSANATVDVSNWNLAKLTVIAVSDLSLQIRATTAESNGTMASATRTVALKLLNGSACATPVGVNPFVSYLNDAVVTQMNDILPISNLVISPLVRDYGICTIRIPAPPGQECNNDVDWDRRLENLGTTIGKAMQDELERMMGKTI